ncbi:MAG: cadherin-like domain-containing protein [candidate division Zixibacteria bacterium]|nr:cadherin-like domain-containing protein [candidate division Zixibacteria bacterium]
MRLFSVLVFLTGFLFFLISACSQKKPVAQKPNQPPQLVLVPHPASPSINENQSIAFGLSAIDLEGTVPALSALGLPKNASFVDSANGRGSFSWTPTFSQEGNYLFSFIASDGALADTERVMISVGNVNRPPFLLPIDSQFFLEGNPGAFGIRGIDPDGDSIFLAADSIPAGAFFMDSLNGRGGFFWSPLFDQAGEHHPVFSVTDRQFTDVKNARLVVLDFNRAPELVPLPDQRVTEGQILSFSIAAADADGDGISLSAIQLPPGAVFVDSGNGKGGFVWQTKVLQANTFFDTSVTFVAASRALADTQAVRIKVDTALLTYTQHTKAIFDTKCTPCHFPNSPPPNPAMCPPYCWNSYSTIFQFRERIRIRVTQGTMPPVPGGLPPGLRDTINAWILRGAPQ